MKFIISLKPWILLVCIMAFVSLACGKSAEVSTQVPDSGAQSQEEPTKIAEISSTPKPTETPEPVNTPTPLPIGLSRANPLPKSDLVIAPNWEIQVLEMIRGDEAWQALKAANMFNEVAPEGMEYILIKLHVKSTYADSDEHTIGGCDFEVTGDLLTKYSCGMALIVEPDPQLDATLYTGGEAEGWAGFLVGKGESNLILIFDETMNFEETGVRFIALDDGASIKVSPDLSGISPTDLGKDRLNPALINEKLTTDNWEFSVLEVIRGEEALKMVIEANQFNDPPESGMEYIAVKMHFRYIGTEDSSQSIDGSFFSTTGSANVIYDSPSVVDPTPSLDCYLYPGGECEGWAVVQAAISETGVSLIVESLWDFGNDSKRFIALQ